jgi:hypothetical protein
MQYKNSYQLEQLALLRPCANYQVVVAPLVLECYGGLLRSKLGAQRRLELGVHPLVAADVLVGLATVLLLGTELVSTAHETR